MVSVRMPQNNSTFQGSEAEHPRMPKERRPKSKGQRKEPRLSPDSLPFTDPALETQWESSPQLLCGGQPREGTNTTWSWKDRRPPSVPRLRGLAAEVRRCGMHRAVAELPPSLVCDARPSPERFILGVLLGEEVGERAKQDGPYREP